MVPHQRRGRDGWEWSAQDSWTQGRPDKKSNRDLLPSIFWIIYSKAFLCGTGHSDRCSGSAVVRGDLRLRGFQRRTRPRWFQIGRTGVLVSDAVPFKRSRFVMEARPHRQFWEVPQDEKRKTRSACNKENCHGEIGYQDWRLMNIQTSKPLYLVHSCHQKVFVSIRNIKLFQEKTRIARK